MAVAWGDFHEDLIFTNDDKTVEATVSASIRSTVANTAASYGKWYFEISIDSYSGPYASGIGVLSDFGSNTLGFYGNLNNSGVCFLSTSGTAYPQRFTTSTSTTFGAAVLALATDNVIQVAMDVDNGYVYFGKNGVFYAVSTLGGVAKGDVIDPADEEGGIGYESTNDPFQGTMSPAVWLNVSGNKFTLRVDSTELIYSPPTGFTAFGDYVPPPINLYLDVVAASASLNASIVQPAGILINTPNIIAALESISSFSLDVPASILRLAGTIEKIGNLSIKLPKTTLDLLGSVPFSGNLSVNASRAVIDLLGNLTHVSDLNFITPTVIAVLNGNSMSEGGYPILINAPGTQVNLQGPVTELENTILRYIRGVV